ncbi:MAG: type I phosphomannose isomerase catalytic subunit [bacterium]|nr:mannose-6-phosphate isomerase [Planctomycetota bacterium]HIL52726.1 mannose-6-phosphate isomerase [Planctomycetota bacterium]
MPPSDPQEAAPSTLDEPLLFERICLPRVWGGRALEETPGIVLDIEGPVGETWELSDRPDHRSLVKNGLHAGRSLHKLLGEHREDLLGTTPATEDDRFPLLVKYLSADKPLSVQVHPDDRTAKRLHGGDCGKDEAWYILAAQPDSLIYLGLRPEVDATTFAALAQGEGLVEALQAWPVCAGQVVNVPAGTPHALGEGIILAEVQQSSDLTYRLYDWGRMGLDGKPRETHVEEALLAIDYETPVLGPLDPEFTDHESGRYALNLIANSSFALSLLELTGGIDADTEGCALIYIVVEGAARLESSTRLSSWELVTGDTWLLPAALGAHRLEATKERAKLIVVTTRK